MTVSLLDLNVLIALAWPHHVHHGMAVRWFGENRGAGWATCPLTQVGFVRISSNRRILPDAVAPQEAVDLLRRWIVLPDHRFWPDDVEFGTSKLVAHERLLGHGQVTDAHLLAVALGHGGRLATFDRGVPDLVPPGLAALEAVALIPLS